MGTGPDIFATKDGRQILVEVTKGSIDWPKTSALERYSQESPNIEVRIISPGALKLLPLMLRQPRQISGS
jgi:hypothetical protein